MVRPSRRLPLYCWVALYWLPAAAAADDPAPGPQKVEVAVDGRSVKINGTTLALPPSRADLVKLLGKPTRVTKLRTTLITWDEHGLYATESPRSGKIEAISVALGRRDYEYWPKQTFRGTARVDGARVTAQSTVAEINRQKQGKPFARDRIIIDSWTIHSDDLMLSLVEADGKDRNAKANFSFFQIGIKKGN
jgi:hypothetical protein